MSFTQPEPATPRLTRSELAVPGVNPALFDKAAKSAADVIFLDLEDAVAPDDKPQARKNVIAALNDMDWGKKVMAVRINGLDTHYMYRDVVDLVEQCPRLDMLVVPKVGVPADLYALDMLVTQIETAQGRSKRIGFEALIETALGLANVEAIAQSIQLHRLLAGCVGDARISLCCRPRAFPDFFEAARRFGRMCAAFLGHRLQLGHDRCCVLCPFVEFGKNAADKPGGLVCTLGELPDLVGDDGKATPLFASTRRFDGGVESEQIGLA